MRIPPASVLATWPTPNYVDPVTRGNYVLIVSVVLLSVAFVVTCLRLYTRLRITCTFGFDDILIIWALAFAIGMCAVTSIATENYGWTRHIWDIPPSWLPAVNKLNLAFQMLFSLSSSITKLSLLWFCKRLLGAGSKGLYSSYNIVLIIGMVIVLICCLLFLFISIFQCSPIRAYWEVAPTYSFHCLNDGAAVFSASVVNIFTDFLTTVLPMPLIWNLKMPARQRVAVISIFGLGIVVNVAGSIRTVYVWKSMVASYDTTWVGWPVLLAASIEISMGLICASAPALRPLVTFFLPRLLQSSRRYASSYGRKSLPPKGWSSSAPTKESRIEDRQYGYQGDTNVDRFEVLRTVEMETWSEIKKPGHADSNQPSSISNHMRVATPTHHVELKNHGVVYTSPGSDKSTASLTRDLNSNTERSVTDRSTTDDKNFF
ncbi:integral membrane protein [Aspergillus japonicus CBS 114.51]|uniref:Integral membrane protein n=2 Tax=Aspergillus TaxID=5052 RepID=A0A2V5I6P9_ASPV1|nr:integral membrane protein [Aspergillus japonicus CBS 114.51]PYI15296.1 integral membrane protein [Aspergillus violaceofuscus CBS 115571]RAH77362.1 integral membrane protein [Aspergillus japonicus CBS 114.51]